ncbi:MAG: MipA/OmpV family protein [Burkholderiaceae bacterium]
MNLRSPRLPAQSLPRRGPAVALILLLVLPGAHAEPERHYDPQSGASSRTHIDIEVESQASEPHSQFALGMSLTSAPEYLGSSRQGLSLKPILAYRYGRFKLTSSGGSSIMNFGVRSDDSGASAELLKTSRWKIKTSARIGGGRSASDSVDLAGLPSIQRTVFARLSVNYKLTEAISLDSTLTWDLLGHDNGASLSAGIGYAFRSSPATEWSFGAGVTYGNATHMRGLFGVPESAATADRPAYEPGAGLRDIGLGAGFITSLSKRWVAFGNVGLNKVIGPAADSPLTHASTGRRASVGIGWRCCR